MKMVLPLHGGTSAPQDIHGLMAGRFPMSLALWCEQNEATEADLERAIANGVPLKIVEVDDDQPADAGEEE